MADKRELPMGSPQKALNEIVLDTATVIDLRESANNEYIASELARAEIEAADPNTKWLSHDEIMERICKRREARGYV
jgi:hypothetical protein